MISNEDLHDLAIKIGHDLSGLNKSVTTAESCTGGWVGKVFTGIPGSSNWYGFGFITYSNRAKLKVLGVKKNSLNTDGAVSESVVKEMAIGAIEKTGSDYAISISGIAGPTGGTEDKPVGTVCFGIGSKNKLNSFTKHFKGNRDEVRKQSVFFALNELSKCLQ